MLFLVKNCLVKRKCVMVHCRDETTNSFVAKVQGEVFTHFHAVTVKQYSSMWNWLFGLREQIRYDQFPWCQRKWWRCCWLCSSPVLLFSVLVNLDCPCTAHAFFAERLPNYCQGLYRTFSVICTELDAVPLSDRSQNQTTPNHRTPNKRT
jgi:hypothetical protein